MRVKLPTIIQDPSSTTVDDKIERFIVKEEEEHIFLDGPVSRRIAVVDFDEETGLLRPGVPFKPPRPNRVTAQYELVDDTDVLARDFNAVSVFATVLKTLRLFESEDCLGRPIRWGFGGPQLLVVPRAGFRANAFYSRASRSLQFFYFPSLIPDHGERMIYTSLSHDIVAHETGHAALDGIVPDLYHALTPQSLALHEAIADLTALIMSYRTKKLAVAVLEKTGGAIDRPSDFSWLAEEFARAKDSTGRDNYLRALDNQKTLDPNDRSRDPVTRRRNFVKGRAEPHRLSQVLTGAFYPAMLRLFEHYRDQEQAKTGRDALSVSGKALALAADHFKRLTLRGLDYLPPGEVSFADYARAALASDQASFPADKPPVREQLRQELARRKIVQDASELEVETNIRDHPAMHNLDLARLVESDWAAYDFANRQRELLGIPEGIHFRVRPRLDVTKVYFRGGRRLRHRECLFKVSWDQREPNDGVTALAADRQITVGTTLAMSWREGEPPRIRALLRSDASRPETEAAREQRSDRDAMLKALVEQGKLDPHSRESASMHLEIHDDLMRVRNLGTLLHMASGEPAHPPTSPTEGRLIPPPGVDASAFFNLVEKRKADQ